VEVEGHDVEALLDAYRRFDAHRLAEPHGQPTMVIAKTVGGRGVSFIEDQADWHIGYLEGADRAAALEEIRAMYGDGGEGA
jgi:transketolase